MAIRGMDFHVACLLQACIDVLIKVVNLNAFLRFSSRVVGGKQLLHSKLKVTVPAQPPGRNGAQR